MSTRPSLRPAALAISAALVAAAAAAAPPAAADFELEAFRWRGDTARARAIVAVNRWGDLRVRTAPRDELVVGAMIQRLGASDRGFAVRVDERADSIVVTVIAPPRPRGRVDLTLIVPAAKHLRATARDGLAEIKYRGDVEVRTRGGDITLEAAGHVRARSDSGRIQAKLTGTAWTRRQALSSARGDVTLWLPADARLALRGGDGGPLVGAAPDGAPELRVASRRGAVRVVPYARGVAR